MGNHGDMPQRNTGDGLKGEGPPTCRPTSLGKKTKKLLKTCRSQPEIHWDPAGRQRHTALMKTFFQWRTFVFLSSHSSQLLVFRYLEQIKAILYCSSRSSLNCDLSDVTAVWNARWTFTVFLNSCRNFSLVERYLSFSSRELKYVWYLFPQQWQCLFTSLSVHDLGYDPWNYRLFPLQCSLENLLLW